MRPDRLHVVGVLDSSPIPPSSSTLMTHAFFKALLFWRPSRSSARWRTARTSTNERLLAAMPVGRCDRTVFVMGDSPLAAFPLTFGFFSRTRSHLLCVGPLRDVLDLPRSGVMSRISDAHLPLRSLLLLPGEAAQGAQDLIDTGHLAPGAPRTRLPARRRQPRSSFRAPSTTSPRQSLPRNVPDGDPRLPRPVPRG